MGVPKFFRFISDRYPCITKIIKEYEIPEYENLYVDMTSIVHTCSHPQNSDIHFRIGKKEFTDEEIFENVCRYVDIIYRIVKPTKLMFLAFDGVAPRAKMNQQRGNRFRVAKNNKELLKEGDILYGNKLFDPNCITPGTKFMAELIDNVKHFLAYKISTDSLWQKCKVILSGSEVPGEGEHKIMQFIRYNKAQPDYNQNTRHCLYSLDADLIILGLCTHEPHFSLIRERNTLGKIKTMFTPEESDFLLLHLSLLREYLDYEFATVKSKLKFEFDLEKIIDDWVLIGFLVGNDFIPNLPDFHIHDGALPLLYQVYIKILPTLDGYINEAGELKLDRFERYIKCLSDEMCINDTKKKFEKLGIQCKNNVTENLENFKLELKHDTEQHYKLKREKHYKIKLKFDPVDESVVHTLLEQYIRAIQWTLSYYYNGCSSWSWFYPYHYAPYILDIKELQNVNLEFDLSKPFLPLQHLLAVLPPANSHLLPEPLRFLLTNPTSPIIEFYPEDFEIDEDGKVNDWEAKALIPFIDEARLINAMEPLNSRLNMRDRKRNIPGSICNFTYSTTSLGQYPVETIFDQFTNHAQLEYIKPENMFTPKDKLVKGLCHKVRFDLSFPGFPTLKYIPHGFQVLEIMNYKGSTKAKKMILNVLPKSTSDLEEIAMELLGRSVYINWPHLKEAHVIGVSDFENRIFLLNFWKKYSTDNIKLEKLSETVRSSSRKENESITEIYRETLGINIGETKVLVYVFPSMGKRYVCGNLGRVNLQTKWSSSSKVFPYQLIVKEVKLFNIACRLYKSITDVFTASSSSVMVSHPNYGSMGKIKNVFLNQQRVAITLNLTKEPNFAETNENFFVANADYMSCSEVAKKLKVSSILVSRITGSFKVTEKVPEFGQTKTYDIGLGVKKPMQNKELFGYTKKKHDWLYSSKVIELIQNYFEKFPDLFENIKKNPASSEFLISDLFPEGFNKLDDVRSWLDEQKASYTIFLECGTKTLGVGVSKVEKIVSDFFSKEQESKTVEANISPQVLFKPGTIIGLVPPDIKAQHKLLDRIICVRNNFTVPLGLKGTIVGIQEKEDKWKNIYEVFFDSAFTGGLTLYESSEHRCYRLTVADFVNISHGQRDAKTVNDDPNLNSSMKVHNKKNKPSKKFNTSSNSRGNDSTLTGKSVEGSSELSTAPSSDENQVRPHTATDARAKKFNDRNKNFPKKNNIAKETPFKNGENKDVPFKQSGDKITQHNNAPFKHNMNKNTPLKNSENKDAPRKKSWNKNTPRNSVSLKNNMDKNMPFKNSMDKDVPLQKSGDKSTPDNNSVNKNTPLMSSVNKDAPFKSNTKKYNPHKNSTNKNRPFNHNTNQNKTFKNCMNKTDSKVESAQTSQEKK